MCKKKNKIPSTRFVEKKVKRYCYIVGVDLKYFLKKCGISQTSWYSFLAGKKVGWTVMIKLHHGSGKYISYEDMANTITVDLVL